MRYIMPEGMRYSTLSERKSFYRDEFDVKRLEKWMRSRKIENTVFACILGRHTGIYLKKFAKIFTQTVLFDDLVDYDELRKSLAKYLPEGAYYDRNLYKERERCANCRLLHNCFRCANFLGQELAFDVDPENLTCPVHGDLAEKMKRHQGLGFCTYEFSAVRQETLKLHEYLEEEFSHLSIVYSGRGFHIHVLDEDAYLMKAGERKRLAREIIGKDILIDEWVTSGEMRLIRLPYSLHGMVSRICMPLSKKGIERFDPVKNKKIMPGFLTRPSLQ
jgi:DNA primase catalytic subunit